MRRWALSFVAVLVLAVVTWNPSGPSYVHWVTDWESGITPAKAFLGVVLTVGWVVAFLSAWKSLGVIPTGLLGAFIGTGLWWAIDSTGATLSARGISYVVLVAIAAMLATAMSWGRVVRAYRERRASPASEA